MTSVPADTPLGLPAPDPPDLLARLRPDGTLAYVDEALCRCFGTTPDELLGKPFLALIDPQDAPGLAADLGTLGPQRRTVVSDARTAGTQQRWLRWTHLGLFDSHERLLEIHSFGRDITHQRQVEMDSARLTAIVAGADDAIASKTLEGIVTSWNPAAERMFGYSAAEVVGRSIALIIPPERLHEEAEILARLKRGEKTEHFETERVRKDGRLVSVSVNVSPVRDAGGRIIGASKIVRDVTDQRRGQNTLEASLRSLEELYRLADRISHAVERQEVCDAALDAITSAMGTPRASVLVFDPEGVLRFTCWRGLSDGYRAATEGHSPWRRDSRNPVPILVDDVLAEPTLAALRDVIVGEGIRALAFVPLVYQERLLGKFMVYFDAPHAFTTEERRLAETIGRHLSFGLARVDAEAAVAEALDRERAARQDADTARAVAEQASRAKDEFLAMLAHELRNPLGVIVHSAGILRAHQALAPELGRTVSMVERQSRHLARLLDDLLDVARITSGHIELEPERLDLRAAVSQAVETQRLRIVAKDQTIRVRLPPAPLEVIGDPVRLQQVIGNLVSNASKYTPPAGSIWVDLEPGPGEAVLRVRDSGAGIPPDRLEAIFELFVQANPTLARTEGGLGVGLTLVKRVVELHKGQVAGHSAGLGQGAEFVVRLPLAEAAEPAGVRTTSAAPAAPEPGSRRILIVEDHEDGREALAALLRMGGHEVHEAASGRAGIALAAQCQPELALVDIGLPDLDGYDVAQALRAALGSRVMLVALTGYGQPADRERAMDAGFDAHLVKPVDTDAIAATLARLED